LIDADLFSVLEKNGPLSAASLGLALGVSQPTISRLISKSALSIARIGNGKNTLYGLLEPILGYSSAQSLHWVTELGAISKFGELIHLAGGSLCIESEFGRDVFDPKKNNEPLPWYLSPLLLQGFLGRQRVQEIRTYSPFLPTNSERWNSSQHLYAALSSKVDSRGAVLVGDNAPELWQATCAIEGLSTFSIAKHYELLAQNQEFNGLPGKSSADGEQPKFVARVNVQGTSTEYIVKYTNFPLDTPVGQRWHDLLVTEQLASEVLARAGFEVPTSKLVTEPNRTFLESKRIDRVGACGRRHMISFAQLHQAFIRAPIKHWVDTGKQLHLLKKLDQNTIRTINILYLFGGLIGNNDMHAGNLSVIVDEPKNIWKQKFKLAPCYDMLAMRWAPQMGRPPEYSPFDATGRFVGASNEAIAKSKQLAFDFFGLLAANNLASKELRAVAKLMCAKYKSAH
jgi:HipA-like C-terminal domain